MDKTKKIDVFTMTPGDIRQVGGEQCRIYSNGSIVIALNGSPKRGNFLLEGEIYHVMEPRFIAVLEGSADICINLEEYHLDKGTVAITSPDVIVEVRKFSADVVLDVMVLRDETGIENDMVVKADAEEFDRILRMIYLVWDIAHATPFRRATATHLFKAIISNVQYIEHHNTPADSAVRPTRHKEQFMRFKQLVNRHCDTERSIPFYAGQMMVTPHHLSAIIKNISGRSVMYWINRATVQKAKMLLSTTSLMVYEVADSLHFPCDSAFSKFFRRETGLTPRQYQIQRESHENNTNVPPPTP